MNIDYVLNIDCRNEDGRLLLQKELKKIKPFVKCKSDVPIAYIEKAIRILCNKYEYMLKVYADTVSGEEYIIWKCEITNCKDLSLTSNTYGCSIYECLAKAVIKLYSER